MTSEKLRIVHSDQSWYCPRLVTPELWVTTTGWRGFFKVLLSSWYYDGPFWTKLNTNTKLHKSKSTKPSIPARYHSDTVWTLVVLWDPSKHHGKPCDFIVFFRVLCGSPLVLCGNPPVLCGFVPLVYPKDFSVYHQFWVYLNISQYYRIFFGNTTVSFGIIAVFVGFPMWSLGIGHFLLRCKNANWEILW